MKENTNEVIAKRDGGCIHFPHTKDFATNFGTRITAGLLVMVLGGQLISRVLDFTTSPIKFPKKSDDEDSTKRELRKRSETNTKTKYNHVWRNSNSRR